MTDLPLLDWKPQGATVVPGLDHERLKGQMLRVFNVMKDGVWRTLRELSDETGDPEASVSARLRDMRKLRFTVERRRRGEPARGLHEYRLVTHG